MNFTCLINLVQYISELSHSYKMSSFYTSSTDLDNTSGSNKVRWKNPAELKTTRHCVVLISYLVTFLFQKNVKLEGDVRWSCHLSPAKVRLHWTWLKLPNPSERLGPGCRINITNTGSLVPTGKGDWIFEISFG